MNPQTLNLFAYTANDPINRTDPDGQFWGFIKGISKESSASYLAEEQTSISTSISTAYR